MRFQSLQHTYLRVPSSLTASITGLQGQSYLDKTDSASTKRLDDSSIVLNGRESDAVFLGPAPDALQVAYEGGGQGGVRVRRSPNCPNTTVWNPAQEKAGGMKDLHEGGWKEFVCVEPGRVVGFEELDAGKTVSLDERGGGGRWGTLMLTTLLPLLAHLPLATSSQQRRLSRRTMNDSPQAVKLLGASSRPRGRPVVVATADCSIAILPLLFVNTAPPRLHCYPRGSKVEIAITFSTTNNDVPISLAYEGLELR